jgi:hypothetical protein
MRTTTPLCYWATGISLETLDCLPPLFSHPYFDTPVLRPLMGRAVRDDRSLVRVAGFPERTGPALFLGVVRAAYKGIPAL